MAKEDKAPKAGEGTNDNTPETQAEDKAPKAGEGTNDNTPETQAEDKEQALLNRIKELENALVVAVHKPKKVDDKPIEGSVHNVVLVEGRTYKPSGSKKTYTLNTIVQTSDYPEALRCWKSGRFKVIPV